MRRRRPERCGPRDFAPQRRPGGRRLGRKQKTSAKGGRRERSGLMAAEAACFPLGGKWPKADRGNNHRMTPLPVPPPPCGGGRQERSAVLPGVDTDSRESPTVSRLAGDRRLPPPPMGEARARRLDGSGSSLLPPRGKWPKADRGNSYRTTSLPVPPPPCAGGGKSAVRFCRGWTQIPASPLPSAASRGIGGCHLPRWGEARARRPPLRRGKGCGKNFSPPLFRTKKLCYNR